MVAGKTQIGCQLDCKVNDFETLVCGVDTINGQVWLCDCCIDKACEEEN